jgi:hypothetical protein
MTRDVRLPPPGPGRPDADFPAFRTTFQPRDKLTVPFGEIPEDPTSCSRQTEPVDPALVPVR